MDMCRQEHLHQVDLLAPAEKKITDREYHVRRRGQKKLNERNKQILADDLIPRKTEFQTQKEFLRSAIEDAASRSCNQEDFHNYNPPFCERHRWGYETRLATFAF